MPNKYVSTIFTRWIVNRVARQCMASGRRVVGRYLRYGGGGKLASQISFTEMK